MSALSWNEIKSRAVTFSKEWENEGCEDSEAKSFLDDFFRVFGVSRRRFIKYESKVKTIAGKDGFIDSIWKGVILVEMKSRGKSLDKAYDQARGYFYGLSDSELPRYVLVSDFQNFRLYDLDFDLQWEFPLKDLVQKVRLFGFLAGYQPTDIPEQDPVNLKAAEEMGKIHDDLKAIGYEGHQLELYLVRMLFCLFADDTTLFNKNQFFDYLAQSKEDGSDLAMRLAQLFELLNTPAANRLKNLPEDLRSFPYVNGQLFAEHLQAAGFTGKMRQQLLHCCRLDWGRVSPAIFGAMFQSVMKPDERRSLGAHYTSEENILKVIHSLFLDELKEEFASCKANRRRLEAFHNKLAGLKFLDPACGCGNFLIISYRELRLLEIEVLKILLGTAQLIDVATMAKVSVDQFYGIEIEEFPAQIAQTAMWLMDHQMNMKMSDEFGLYYVRLPLTAKANIVRANALVLDWKTVIPPEKLTFIFGNPPFVGAMNMTVQQRKELQAIFGASFNGAGEIDYVAAWFVKAAQYIDQTQIRCAFVATNSICQGQQVGLIWKELMTRYRIEIDFAHRTFKWSNEAKGNASVFCIIVGFSQTGAKKKHLFDYENVSAKEPQQIQSANINPYLVDAVSVFIYNRSYPLSQVPRMSFGSMPRDGGGLILSDAERESLLAAHPVADGWIRPYVGSFEFINRKNRWCLWLDGVDPSEIRGVPPVMKRIEFVRQFRSSSVAAETRRFADTPALFCQIAQPGTDYILVPRVSSERRKYIPMGFVHPNVIASDAVLIIPDAAIYHLGVLTSSMHMAWTRYTCGRLKSDYRYSKDIVYNNFPWPLTTEQQRQAITAAAQAVLSARELYPQSSLADLYDPLTMPPVLVKAHQKLDAEVEKAYGKRFASDADRVAFLFDRYAKMAL
ncbi:MAG TPA: SAM-dependent methyltransferase [Clostridiales bacterium]|nr:SAM-dependent methyltransferase [Clostridiales bacterium]